MVFWGDGFVIKTNEGGQNWAWEKEGLPENPDVHAFTMNASKPQELFVWVDGPVSRAFLENLMLPGWIIKQMYIPALESYVHPTFLYESLWNLAVFAFLLFYRRNETRQSHVRVTAGSSNHQHCVNHRIYRCNSVQKMEKEFARKNTPQEKSMIE
jgi:hypothetical protein